MSTTGLEAPAEPIALLPGNVPTEPSSFTLKQRDSSWRGWDFTAIDANGNLIVQADDDNLHKVRHFKDASGNPLFDLHRRYHHLHDVWTVKGLYGDETAEPPLTTDLKLTLIKVALDIKLRNAAVRGEGVVLEARGQDKNIISTHVTVGGRRIMEVTRLLEGRDVWGSSNQIGHRGSWQASVAGGVDLVLAVLIVAMLSEFSAIMSKHY